MIQGKGKGLVAVLHGPPGTGKTLTAEGISELLKCPLYMVSAGELGTDPRPVGLEDDLRDLAAVGPAGGDTLGAARAAAVQQHHVGIFRVHLVEHGPDAR